MIDHEVVQVYRWSIGHVVPVGHVIAGGNEPARAILAASANDAENRQGSDNADQEENHAQRASGHPGRRRAARLAASHAPI